MLPALEEEGLTRAEGRELAERMFRAASRAFEEYEQSHNPPAEDGVLDYSFRRRGCAYDVLDGRGQRDISRASFRILGREQFDRFAAWAEGLDGEETAFLFVVSAVPVLHTRAGLVNADEQWLIDQAGLGDDLRDSWEHELHDEERGALLDVLFGAAARGIRVWRPGVTVMLCSGRRRLGARRALRPLTINPFVLLRPGDRSWSGGLACVSSGHDRVLPERC